MVKSALLIAVATLVGCSSTPVKWPSGCNPSIEGKIFCKCEKLQYVRESHPKLPQPAFKQTIRCDGENLPIEALSEK